MICLRREWRTRTANLLQRFASALSSELTPEVPRSALPDSLTGDLLHGLSRRIISLQLFFTGLATLQYRRLSPANPFGYSFHRDARATSICFRSVRSCGYAQVLPCKRDNRVIPTSLPLCLSGGCQRVAMYRSYSFISFDESNFKEACLELPVLM